MTSETFWVSSNGVCHSSERCAGESAMPMSAAEAAEHADCGVCIGSEHLKKLEAHR